MKKFLLSALLVTSVASMNAEADAAAPTPTPTEAPVAKTWAKTLGGYVPNCPTFVTDAQKYVETAISANPKTAALVCVVTGFLVAKALDYATAKNADEEATF